MSRTKIAHYILRIGLAITFIWIGVFIYRDPVSWGSFLKPWAASLLPISLKTAMFGTAALDIAIGLTLLAGYFVWLAGGIAALHILVVIITTGINAITVRDIGLLAATIVLSLIYWPAKKAEAS